MVAGMGGGGLVNGGAVLGGGGLYYQDWLSCQYPVCLAPSVRDVVIIDNSIYHVTNNTSIIH